MYRQIIDCLVGINDIVMKNDWIFPIACLGTDHNGMDDNYPCVLNLKVVSFLFYIILSMSISDTTINLIIQGFFYNFMFQC